MSKLTDKIEDLHGQLISKGSNALAREIIADVRELEQETANARAAAVGIGQTALESRTQAIRAAKREAYEHMLSLVGNASHAAKAIHAAIDALDTEVE